MNNPSAYIAPPDGNSFGGFLANLGQSFNGALGAYVDVRKNEAIASAQANAIRLQNVNQPAYPGGPTNFGQFQPARSMNLGSMLPLLGLALVAVLVLKKA